MAAAGIRTRALEPLSTERRAPAATAHRDDAAQSGVLARWRRSPFSAWCRRGCGLCQPARRRTVAAWRRLDVGHCRNICIDSVAFTKRQIMGSKRFLNLFRVCAMVVAASCSMPRHIGSADSQSPFEIGSRMNTDVFAAFTDHPWQRRQPSAHPTLSLADPGRKLCRRQKVIQVDGLGTRRAQPQCRGIVLR